MCSSDLEPAGVTGFAGLQKMVRQGRISPEERIVVLVTGNGLKDVGSAIRASGTPHLIEPSLDDLKRLLLRLSVMCHSE